MTSIHPKTFYHNYLANNDLFEIDYMLVKHVLVSHPQSVFDFGCGTGKNLRLIQENYPKISLMGLDMSLMNIIYGRAKNNLPCLILGDEYSLCRIRGFGVAMTCSVLCHIENIVDIVEDLKKVAPRVVIAETTDIVGDFYYAHDYEKLGFRFTEQEWYSPVNQATYKIYEL